MIPFGETKRVYIRPLVKETGQRDGPGDDPRRRAVDKVACRDRPLEGCVLEADRIRRPLVVNESFRPIQTPG